MKLVVLKNGGQPGKVAVNVDMVTHVRSSSGPFTDIYFGEHKVAVEGTLEQVISRLTGEAPAAAEKPDIRTFLPIR